MELHDHLYALGLQSGRAVFDDPEGLRALLVSAGVSAAEVELLVDAVRRGVFRGLLTALDNGLDATRAVEEAGARLGRERGSDPGPASWALAVLGFAVGRLGENDVRRHRDAPPAVPPGPLQSETPTYVGPPSSPTAPTPPAPAYQPTYQPGYQPGHQPGYQPGTRSRSRLPVVLGVVGTVAAIVIAVVIALVVAGGGSGTDSAGEDDSSSPTSTEATSTDPTSDTTSDTTGTTTEPTTETTTTEPPVDPDRVTDEAAAGFTTALLTFSGDFAQATDKLSAASDRDDLRGMKVATREVRRSVYDFDLATRALDLTPVQSEVNSFLRVSGRMITKLDRIERTATTTLAVNIGILGLPIPAYTSAFQEVGNAIDATRAGG